MPNEYDPKTIEKKWQNKWQESGIYKSDESSLKPKYYILDMFPYPSGEGLHVGHPKGYIATDIISRMKRMQGFNVLHPMGWDAFGLPAENYAIKNKVHPRVAVDKNVIRFKEQLSMIGFDYDWSREVNTTDPEFYKWTQWIFLKLLEKGLAYESNEPVNWCPVDKTVLSNEDLEDGKCERCGSVVEQKPIRQWVLKITDYADRLLEDLEDLDWPKSIKESQKNWIGKSEGAEIDFELKFIKTPEANENRGPNGEKAAIKIFTTRPDTLFGATYMVLAPEHPWVTLATDENHDVLENKEEVKSYVETAKNKSEIDRSALNKEKTGVELKGVKAINPATNEEIPVWVADYVLPNYGTGAIMAVPAHDERDGEFAAKYNIPVKQVVMTAMVDANNPPREGLSEVFRHMILAAVYDPKSKKYLVLKWKKLGWVSFVTGGVDESEDRVEAAKREIAEETGYTNVKFIKSVGLVEALFCAAHKNENRRCVADHLFFELVDDSRVPLAKEDDELCEVEWLSLEELKKVTLQHAERDLLMNSIEKGTSVHPGEGTLMNSGEFNGLKTEEARKKITEKFGKLKTTYKLRDWVFSRQRYWGEPIPVMHDGDKIVPLDEKELPLTLPMVESYEPTGEAESPLAAISDWMNVKVGDKVLRRESNTMPQWAGSSWYYLRYMDPKNNNSLVDKKREEYWNMVDLYVGGAEHATRHLIYARFWHKFLYDLGVVSTKEPFKRLQNVGLIIAEDGRKMSKRWGNVINPDDVINTFGADTLRTYEMFMGPFDQSVAWNNSSMVGVRRFLEKVWRFQNKVVAGNETSVTLHQTVKKVTEDIGAMKFNTAVSALMILANDIDGRENISQTEFETLIKILAPFAPHLTEEVWQSLGKSTSIHLEAWPEYDESKLVSDKIVIAVQVNGKVRGTFEASSSITEVEAVALAKALPDVVKWISDSEVKKAIYVPKKVVSLVL